MKQNKRRNFIAIEDPEPKIGELYDLFNKENQELMKKQGKVKKQADLKCCTALFLEETTDDDGSFLGVDSRHKVEKSVMKPISTNRNGLLPARPNRVINNRSLQSGEENKPSILAKVLANTKNPKKQAARLPDMKYNEKQQLFGFNSDSRVTYAQTPGFKSLLQSPFGKFNSLFKDIITTLSKNSESELDSKINNFDPIDLESDPLTFYNKNKNIFQISKYIIGIALKLKDNGGVLQSLYFCHLSCFADPFSQKPWRKYVVLLEEQGKLDKACVMAKTGFLLTQSEQLIKSFLINGEKCGYPLYKIQGIICSVSNPELFEKTLLPDSARLQIKYGKSWKGIKIMLQICKANDFKLPVCLQTLFLARFLQNSGYQDKAMQILKQSFSKAMSKLEIYMLYIQMSIRKNQCLLDEDFQQVLKYKDCISGENRFRFLLEMAEILYKNNDQRYYLFIYNAFTTATEFCAPGAGCSKALKQIYFTVAKLRGIMPQINNIYNDQTVFQINRNLFINGNNLIEYEFSDWKYYLHYGVTKRHDLLITASKKWPQTGRVIAELMHCLRLVKKPLTMLKLWRQKIEEVPKSGELWCEGGRIYAELGEYQNASKCFKYAIHFTPQYGDSFIEELRLLLRESRFLEISKLKKLFLVCEPFYGHVLSYIKLNDWRQGTLTLSQVWQNAIFQISSDLYKNGKIQKQPSPNHVPCHGHNIFTAYPPYNQAYQNPDDNIKRHILFSSYEQMQNKN